MIAFAGDEDIAIAVAIVDGRVVYTANEVHVEPADFDRLVALASAEALNGIRYALDGDGENAGYNLLDSLRDIVAALDVGADGEFAAKLIRALQLIAECAER